MQRLAATAYLVLCLKSKKPKLLASCYNQGRWETRILQPGSARCFIKAAFPAALSINRPGERERLSFLPLLCPLGHNDRWEPKRLFILVSAVRSCLDICVRPVCGNSIHTRPILFHLFFTEKCVTPRNVSPVRPSWWPVS